MERRDSDQRLIEVRLIQGFRVYAIIILQRSSAWPHTHGAEERRMVKFEIHFAGSVVNIEYTVYN